MIVVTAGRDDDVHRPGQTCQRFRGGVRHDDDRQRLRAFVHQPGMLKREGALPAAKAGNHPLHRDVTGRAFDAAAKRKHLADAGALQVAMKGLVDRHAGDRTLARTDRRKFHTKGANRFLFRGGKAGKSGANGQKGVDR